MIPNTSVDQTLIFKVSRYDEVNNRWKRVGVARTFKVKVRVNVDAMASNTWGFLLENPEYLLSQILIPIVTFLAGMWRGKRQVAPVPEA